MEVTRDKAREVLRRLNVSATEGAKDCFTVPTMAKQFDMSPVAMRKVCDQWVAEGTAERTQFTAINGWNRRQVLVGYRLIEKPKKKRS